MNIFTLITLIIFAVFGYFGGKLLAHYYGVLGWVLGILGGSALFGVGYFLIMHYLNKWFPIHPICRTGRCTSEDYVIVEYNQEEGTCIFCCKCGTKYFQDHPYFKEILSDGSLRSYMKKSKRLGKWEIDDHVVAN